MGFVRISESTATASLTVLSDWLFVMEMQHVFYEVGTIFLNTVRMNYAAICNNGSQIHFFLLPEHPG
jgi:hypothetical protein